MFMYFKQYFTHQEFKEENFKSHLTLPFCKIYRSHINFGRNHTSRLNPLPPSGDDL